jgi:glycosyltransferase involved in cell wall biosynthesis
MRILINLLNFRPGRVGGTETYLRELVACLPETAQGEHLILLTSSDVAREFRHSPIELAALPLTTAQICGLRLLEAASTRFHAVAIEAAIRRLRPDVVLFPQQSMFPGRVPCPAVLVVHDLYHIYFPQHLTHLQRWFRSRSYPRALERADQIIAISEFTRRTIVENSLAGESRITVVPHGLRELDPAAIEPPAGLPPRYLYYPASTLPHKNHDQLLDAIAGLRRAGRFPWKMVLSGEQTKHWGRLRRLISRARLDDVILHLGYVDYGTVLRVMRGTECLVFPSLFEGFGIPILEAAALDRRICTSRLPVFDEIGVPSACQVDFADLDQLARVLARPAPTRLVRRPTTWSACAAATLDVLRLAAKGAGACHPTHEPHLASQGVLR